MIHKILTGRIHPPQIFFAPDKEGGGALEAGNFTPAQTSADNEIPPDFGDLEAKFGDGAPPAVEKPAEVVPPPDETEQQRADRARDEKGRFKPKEEEMPEIPASKPAPPVEEKAKPAEPPPKPAETPPPAAPEKKVEATPPPAAAKPPVPDDDKDIDAIQAKPTASEKTRNDFEIIKGHTKAARAEARELRAKLAEAEKKAASPEYPDDVKAKLAEHAELDKFRRTIELENHPASRAAYAEKLTKSEDGILKFLQEHPKLKLQKETADRLKTVGFDSEEGIKIRDWIFSATRESTKDEVLIQKIAGLFNGREEVIEARKTEIAALREDQGKFLQQQQDKEKNEFHNWGKIADDTLTKLAEGAEWANFKPIPEGSTPEQKALIDAHNERVKQEVVPAFNKMTLDAFQRKPAETIKIIFDAFRASELDKQNAGLTEELKTAVERIKELEALAGGVRRITNLSDVDSASKTPPIHDVTKDVAGSAELDAEAAIDAFRREKGLTK